MSSTNLGRVQGAGLFYSSAASGTSIAVSTLQPSIIKPLVGDSVVFGNGDVRNITVATETAVDCGTVVMNIKGTSVRFTYDNLTNTLVIREV